MRTQWKTHVAYRGWMYLLIILISGIFWNTVYEQIHAIKDEERVIVFTAGNVDYQEFEDDLLRFYQNQENSIIKQVTMSFQSPSERLFFGIFETMLINGTDVILIPETMINENFGKTYFLPISEANILQHFSSETLYREEGVAYGIRLNQSDSEDVLDSYLIQDLEVTYYAFIPTKSTHLHAINSTQIDTNNEGIQLLYWLLGRLT